MQLDRAKFIKAIKFLKPAVSKADEQEQNVSAKIKVLTHIHVKIDGDVCTMTASDSHCGKRVILNKPPQLLLEEKHTEIEDGEYLIPRATAEAFDVLCQKHKARFEKSAKIDHSLKNIDIFSDSLESHKDVNRYEQPVGVTYPNLDTLFYANGSDVQNMKVNPLILIDALKEFHNIVEITFSGPNGPVYMRTEDLTYQAFFMPVQTKGDDE